MSTLSTTAADSSGSWFAIILSPQEMSCGASSWGTVKIEHRKRIGSSRLIAATKSNGSSSTSAWSSTPRATSRIQSSYWPTPRALKRFVQTRRSCVCRGRIRLQHRAADLELLGVQLLERRRRRPREENVSQSMWTAVRSS